MNANTLKLPNPMMILVCILAIVMIAGGFLFKGAPQPTTTTVDASSFLGNLSASTSSVASADPPSLQDVLGQLTQTAPDPDAVPTLDMSAQTQRLMDDAAKAGFNGIPIQGLWSTVDMTADSYKAKAAIVMQQLAHDNGITIRITPQNNNGEPWIFTPIIGWHKCMSILDVDHYNGALMDAEFWFATPKAFRQAMFDECQSMKVQPK